MSAGEAVFIGGYVRPATKEWIKATRQPGESAGQCAARLLDTVAEDARRAERESTR